VWLEGLGKLKKFTSSRTRTGNLPTCSIVPQPTTLPRAPNEQYQVKISNRFTALENLDNDVDINRAWETIRENIIISAKEHLGYYKFKNKPRLDEGCSTLFGQRKQEKLLWLQDPSQKMG
jgi:hypothetical protein